ncbi:MAG: NIPSNAP family protein [Tannerella sp.]|nr:NIPSNAP family protein [Tannerella sp.]
MKRRNFMKAAAALSVAPVVSQALPLENKLSFSKDKEIYEWRIYTLAGNGDLLDAFLKDTLIPVYNRKNIRVGAFKLYKLQEEDKEQRHLLLIYPDITTYHQVKKTIWSDPDFRQNAQTFYDTTAPAPVYSNFESYLCEAFDKIPVLRKPEPERTLFELRIYHSPNEEANQRKVKMFNMGEIDVFDKVGINSVFYGEILAGPRMPALLYLTWYKDEETRNKAWKEFGSHPEWKRMAALPEYAYTATNNQSIFLSPLPYSQL